jgi:sensor histidine kinase YesM
MANFNPTFTPEERHRILMREAGSHPIEMFRPFRRWKRGFWRDLLYTLIWNTGFTVLFVFLGMVATMRLPSPGTLWVSFVISNCVGYCLHVLFLLAGHTIEPAIRRRSRVAITAYYMAITTVGVIAGFWVAYGLLGREFLPRMGDARWVIGVAITSMVISIVLAIVFFWREKSAIAEAALEREQRRTADIEREAMAANLRALQAQIEPHFLFNTLANVTSLIDSDPARAKHMAESFIRFLRASLAATRRSRTTLADEFALIGDFLAVLKVRMGDRLDIGIDLPADLAGLEIPPMLVQPVVENAIRHGLEPKVEGGLVELRARRTDGRLVLEVADTGVGFGEATSGGVGLANIRERLRLAHGDAARLAIRENAPGGTVVAIELPAGAS